jgi:hypothetical protein
MFVPTVSVKAVYVKIKINSTSASGGGSFSLPAGTKITILSGSTPIGTVKTLSTETPVGSYIWSSDVILTSGQSYNAKLEVPLCTGKLDSRNGYCWYKGGVGQNCTTVCNTNGTTNRATCNEVDTGCVMLYLFGFTGSCYSGGYGSYSYYNNCYPGGSMASCSWSDANATRICACNSSLGTFSFPFTASF